MNIRNNIYDNVIRKKNISLTTLLKLPVDTISPEYVEKNTETTLSIASK